MDDDDQMKVDVGMLKKEVQHLQEDINSLREALKDLSAIMTEVKSLLDQYKGFGVAMLLCGGIVGWFVYSMQSIRDFFSGHH